MKKILIVDDDVDTLEVMELVLGESNFEIFISSKRPSLDEVIEKNPTVILLDYFLGDGVCKEFCLELKEHLSTKNIPVILMSAHNNIANFAKDSCADAFIAKPFDIDVLEQLVKRQSA